MVSMVVARAVARAVRSLSESTDLAISVGGRTFSLCHRNSGYVSHRGILVEAAESPHGVAIIYNRRYAIAISAHDDAEISAPVPKLGGLKHRWAKTHLRPDDVIFLTQEEANVLPASVVSAIKPEGGALWVAVPVLVEYDEDGKPVFAVSD